MDSRRQIDPFFHLNVYHNDLHSATNAVYCAVSPLYPIRSRHYSLKLPLARQPIGVNSFTIAYSKYRKKPPNFPKLFLAQIPACKATSSPAPH